MSRVKVFFRKYPKQFWLLMAGSFIFTTGSSLVWPFLSIYLQQKLAIPLRYSTLLISLRAFSGIAASFFFAGPFADRMGRRILILASLFGGFVYYIGLKFAASVWQFAVLMAFWGILDLLYPVGINAMLADFIPVENRLEAYSILKIVYNAGYAIGPILGGFMVSCSYNLNFNVAAAGFAASFVFMLIFAKETLTPEQKAQSRLQKNSFSFVVVLKDMFFCLSVFLMGIIYITSAGVFNLLSLYAVQNFGIPENRISYVYTVNAVMCVTLQLPVVRLISGKKQIRLMWVSALLYMLGGVGIAVMGQVWWYCICMAVLTFGELIMSPTMSDLAARLAPPDARGRYMSLLSLARPFGQGIGPAVLGYVNDVISPRMMWVCGAGFAAAAFTVFLIMDRRSGHRS